MLLIVEVTRQDVYKGTSCTGVLFEIVVIQYLKNWCADFRNS
jgi:hypothetical protein